MSLKRAFDEQDEGSISTYAGDRHTLSDLYRAINMDYSLSSSQKSSLLAEIKRVVGFASDYTPLQELMTGRFNDTIRALISKYFSMNMVAQQLAASLGGGLGANLFGAMPKKQPIGWRLL